jgi:hypothetical protein
VNPDLIKKVEGLASPASNELDVLIEVALFEPDATHQSCRANSAGTKVIYTRHAGGQDTHWAPDWTGRNIRSVTLERLRSLEARDKGDG